MGDNVTGSAAHHPYRGGNMHGKYVECSACKKMVLWETTERSKVGRTTNYYCRECSSKDVLVYQPHYKRFGQFKRGGQKYRVIP